MQKNNDSSIKEKKNQSFSQKLLSLGKTLLIFSVSIIVGLLIGEGIIRMLYKKEMVLFPRYHTDASYGNYKIRKIRPNMSFSHTSFDGTFHFKTNSKGFRNDSDISYNKAKGEIRILSLGDSHTQGYEVNQQETFTYVTEKILDNNGNNSTAINMGVSGFSTAEELILLENEGYKYQPDYVVVGFYANDFEDNLRTNLFEVKSDSLVTKNIEYIPGVNIQNGIYKYWIFRFLGERSYLYGFAFNTIWDFYKKRKTKESGGNETEFAVANKENSSDYSRQLMKKIIARMYDVSKRIGAKLIILDIPGFASDGSVTSSVTDDILPHVKANCDTLFYYGNMIEDYKKLSLIHLKHGHRHISAETHKMLGQKVASYILEHKQIKNETYSFK